METITSKREANRAFDAFMEFDKKHTIKQIILIGKDNKVRNIVFEFDDEEQET